MAYEHMVEDPKATISAVAEFMDIDLDAELLAITANNSSLPFMQKHKNRFDDLLIREDSHARAGIPVDSDSAKVRTGLAGQAREKLSVDISAEIDAIWNQTITAEFGFDSYEAMIATLK
jgi:hypothetical protein